VPASLRWQFEACGDSCIVVVFATLFSAQANRRAVVLSDALHDLQARGKLCGITDVVPALVTVGVHYCPYTFAIQYPHLTPFDAVAQVLENALMGLQNTPCTSSKQLEIPVCYEGEYAPDLLHIANACAMTPSEVIAAHSGQWVDVLMVGFAPGHPYIGMHPPALKLARRTVPRTVVKIVKMVRSGLGVSLVPLAGLWLEHGSDVRVLRLDTLTFYREIVLLTKYTQRQLPLFELFRACVIEVLGAPK